MPAPWCKTGRRPFPVESNRQYGSRLPAAWWRPRAEMSRRRNKSSSPSLRISELRPCFARYPKLSSRRRRGLLRGVAPSIQGQSRINAYASCLLPRVLCARTYRKHRMFRQVYLRLQAAVLFGVFLTWVAVLIAVWLALCKPASMRRACVWHGSRRTRDLIRTCRIDAGGGAAKLCRRRVVLDGPVRRIRGSISRFGPQHWL